MYFENLTDEEIADLILSKEIGQAKWEKWRVSLGSILNVDHVYEHTRDTVQRLLNSSQVKEAMRQPDVTEYDIFSLIEKLGALNEYKTSLERLLTKTDSKGGVVIQNEIYHTVEVALLEH